MDTVRSPRARRPLTAAFCVCVVAAGLLVGGQGAAASGHATARRTARVHAHARVTRSATATRTVTVAGHTATASARGRATVRAVATATATARAWAATHHAAARRAATQARSAARRKALARARRRASARAAALAGQRAQRAAQQQATAAATRLANQPSQGSSPPSELGGTGGSAGVSVGVGAGGTDVGVGPCGGQSPAKPGGGTWTCTFDDEFDGTALDLSKWSVQQTASSGYAQGGACYVANPADVSVGGGTLNLTVRKQATPFTCPSPAGAFSTSYSAGEVTTLNTFSQTYGRFEVRAELPPATAAGLQETFWLWPLDDQTYGPWPGSGELDFAEFYSQYPGWTIPYFHYDYDRASTSAATDANVVTALPGALAQPGTSCSFDQSAFNTYTFTWEPGRLTVQVNGQDCLVDDYAATGLSGAAPFDQPFFLALTQALGVGANAPTADTPLPATTRIDYVRVWS